MTQTIKTKKGYYHFEPVNLYHGRKKLDKNVARENLLITRKILNKSKIGWGLIFGTLLGAIREEDFIDHDEDVDLFILDEDRERLIELIFEFEEYGFSVARYSGSIMSIIRNNEYIDFYFFKRSILGRRSGEYFLPKIFFSKNSNITFLGAKFPTVYKPKDCLSLFYGKDWRVPKSNIHAAKNPVFWKKTMKNFFPFFYNFYQNWKNENR